MHPILLEIPKFEIGGWIIGPLSVRMYGLMIGTGFLLGLFLASRHAKREGLDPDRFLDMGVYLLIAAIAGSRVLYVITEFREFANKPLEMFAIWNGGLVFYGGLIAAVPMGLWYVRKYSLPAWNSADIMAPYIALGHGFGRMGCFFAGCCYGAACNSPISVTFTDPRSLAPLNVPLFPTQLVEAGGEFLIFGALLILWRYKKFDGQIFSAYLLFYSMLRFVIEFYRGDAIRGVYFNGMVSTSQIIASGLFVVSLFMLWRFGQKKFRHEM